MIAVRVNQNNNTVGHENQINQLKDTKILWRAAYISLWVRHTGTSSICIFSLDWLLI